MSYENFLFFLFAVSQCLLFIYSLFCLSFELYFSFFFFCTQIYYIFNDDAIIFFLSVFFATFGCFSWVYGKIKELKEMQLNAILNEKKKFSFRFFTVDLLFSIDRLFLRCAQPSSLTKHSKCAPNVTESKKKNFFLLKTKEFCNHFFHFVKSKLAALNVEAQNGRKMWWWQRKTWRKLLNGGFNWITVSVWSEMKKIICIYKNSELTIDGKMSDTVTLCRMKRTR